MSTKNTKQNAGNTIMSSISGLAQHVGEAIMKAFTPKQQETYQQIFKKLQNGEPVTNEEWKTYKTLHQKQVDYQLQQSKAVGQKRVDTATKAADQSAKWASDPLTNKMISIGQQKQQQPQLDPLIAQANKTGVMGGPQGQSQQQKQTPPPYVPYTPAVSPNLSATANPAIGSVWGAQGDPTSAQKDPGLSRSQSAAASTIQMADKPPSPQAHMYSSILPYFTKQQQTS